VHDLRAGDRVMAFRDGTADTFVTLPADVQAAGVPAPPERRFACTGKRP